MSLTVEVPPLPRVCKCRCGGHDVIAPTAWLRDWPSGDQVQPRNAFDERCRKSRQVIDDAPHDLDDVAGSDATKLTRLTALGYR